MIQRSLRLIGGDADIGKTPLFWIGFAIAVLFFALYPTQVSAFRASNVAYYLLNVPMGLGMALLWGYCGVLSFGHVAYFGIAAYLYGIIAGNMATSSWGPLIGVGGGLLGCAIVAAIFGLLRLLCTGAEVDHPDPDPGLHLVARDLSGADRGIPVACGHGAVGRLQRHDRHPLVSGRRLRLRGLCLLLPLPGRRAGKLLRTAHAGERQVRAGRGRHARRRTAHRDAGLRHPFSPMRGSSSSLPCWRA